jgi:hypothetical protein
MREQRIRIGSKNVLNLNHTDDLCILDENVSKVNELFRGFASSGCKVQE